MVAAAWGADRAVLGDSLAWNSNQKTVEYRAYATAENRTFATIASQIRQTEAAAVEMRNSIAVVNLAPTRKIGTTVCRSRLHAKLLTTSDTDDPPAC